ncbi:MAG: glycosyltransferase family 2 protein [bacterium]|nr:glycosyltransferase family 2 protein [bacterium]
MKTTILIGCFNEKRTIAQAIQEAKQLKIDKEIIVIDNCSTDGTREILKSIDDGSIRMVFQPKNYGAGRSGRLGMRMAKGDYFYAQGADLEYKMTDVLTMIKKLEDENLDAVFGSRLLNVKNKSKLQLIKERPFWLGSIISTFLINKFYHRNFTDVIAPKLIKTDILKNLGCVSDNQALEFELVSRLCKKGYKIGEVPVYYKPRTAKEGKKVKWFDMIYAIIAMIRVKLL